MNSLSGTQPTLRNFIGQHLRREARQLWGDNDNRYLESVLDEWLADTTSSVSAYRMELVRAYAGEKDRILDVGSGCGAFVYFALKAGFEAFGVEPDAWRLEACRMKAKEREYPRAWLSHFIGSRGEKLPFLNESFDVVSSYRALEHVQDLNGCIAEMVRVTKPGGIIHISVPDYSLSTFEGHYRMAWIPGIRGRAAEAYVRMRRKPVRGVRSLNFVSARRIRKALRKAGRRYGRRVECVDVGRRKAAAFFRSRGFPPLPGAVLAYRVLCCARSILRTTYAVDLIART